jgi:hypothetical protein
MLGSTDVMNRLFLFIIHVHVLCLFLFFVVVLMNQSCGRFGAVQGGRRKGGGHKMYAKLGKLPQIAHCTTKAESSSFNFTSRSD